MPLKQSPTQLVVGGIIAVALFIVAFKVAGLYGGLLLTAILAYEGWTLVNQFPNYTISEIMWGLADRPLVPFIFGTAFGWGVASGFLANPWLVGALGFVLGHFFWQKHEE